MIPTLPLSSGLSSELFHLTYLSSSHQEKSEATLEGVSISLIFDRLIGVMRFPYLAVEAKRVYDAVQESGSLWDSPEVILQTVSVVGSSMEVLLWLHQRKWTRLSPYAYAKITIVSSLSRIALYEHAVLRESQALYNYRKLDEKHPNLNIKLSSEYQLIRLQFISHITYLVWSTLSLISYVKGIPYPREFMKLLHFTTFFFGLLSMQYEEESQFKHYFKKNFPFLPNPNIYEK